MARKIYKNRDEMRKNTIAVPVNAIEKAKVKAEADKRGLTGSAYCRHMLIYGKEMAND